MRGVNLGSQFIIEPWMAYDEFSSMGCGEQNDEWSCVQHLGQEAANAAFASHWNTWITQEDIIEIASFGLNTVRIPVGFWIKEDLVLANESFPQGGLQYLDRIVGWCADAGLYVIMDLHGGPSGQTANQQFTGHSVSYPGWFTPFNYERTLQFLEWMTERILTNPSYKTVGTLEVMNEPAQAWEHPDLAADMVQNFYPQALARVRAKEQSLGISSDAALDVQYMSTAWGSGNPSSYLNDTISVSYDDHRYLKWDTSVTATRDGYIEAACNDNRGDVVVGEWSIAVADDVSNSPDFQIANATQAQIDWYQKYWATQVAAYEKSTGWIFWSWKCNWIGGTNDWRWCYQTAVEAGVTPKDASQAGAIAAQACANIGSDPGSNATVPISSMRRLKRREHEHIRRHKAHGHW